MSILRISPHNPRTLVWWNSRRELIDFSPPYQRRGRIWSHDDKAFLIDSIINGFDVPKLYLADFQIGQSGLNSSKLPYAVIDGKQRLEAVFDFFDNKITLRSDFRFRRDYSLDLRGLSLKDLRNSYPRVAEEFENAHLDIMSVFAEDERDINEIFIRLNKSKPLTGAEVRNALSGPVSELVRVIASHLFFVENAKFSVSRAADLNAAAKLLLFEYHGAVATTKKVDLDFFAQSDVNHLQLELAGRRVLDVLDAMSQVFIPKDPLLSSAGIVPVYYWFIRGLDKDQIASVREFLLFFEEQRRLNRESQKGPMEMQMDSSYSRFDTLNRSTNDAQSHSGRVKILRMQFEGWDRTDRMDRMFVLA